MQYLELARKGSVVHSTYTNIKNKHTSDRFRLGGVCLTSVPAGRLCFSLSLGYTLPEGPFPLVFALRVDFNSELLEIL